MKLRRGLPLFALLLCATGLAGRAEAAEDAAGSASWTLGDVEIPESVHVTRGQLENGVHYVIRPHASPSRQLSLRLLVAAGSLHENDDERGFAHFVEHMAFNGTKHFPAGELIRFLQRQGVQFGPHINAFTSHTRTVYKLDLPDGTPAMLETGLRIFRDFSDGILFEAAEVKRERGVILGEERMRRTSQRAEQLALIDLLYADTRIPAREPIGMSAQIERADRAALRRFYDAWYRPERLTVIVVGDVAPPAAEALIRAQFASLAARGSARAKPVLAPAPQRATPAVAIHRRPLPGLEVSFISISDRPHATPTWNRYLTGLRVHAALNIVRDRLNRLKQQPGALINDVKTRGDTDYLRFRHVSVSVSAAPKHFADAVALLDQELRRALEFGFEDDEVTRQKDIVGRAVQSTADALATAPAATIADRYVDLIEDDSPLLLLDESLEQVGQCIDQLTPANCQSALREFFGSNPTHLFVSCAADYVPAAEKVREAWLASHSVAVEPVDQTRDAVVFAYEDFGPAGAVVDKNYIADLDFTQLRFANDVCVNLKRTPFDAGHVRFVLRVGYGRLAEPADQPGLGLWFQFLWHGGTGRHPVAEFSRIYDGLQGVSLTAGDDAFVITGRVSSGNLPRTLRQLTALVADPAFRTEGWESAQSTLRGLLSPLWNRPEGTVAQLVRPLLAGKDLRVGMPGDSAYLARTPEQFRAWFAPQLATGPLEFSLIGDFDPEAIAGEVGLTLGTLAPRESRDEGAFRTQLDFLQDRRGQRYFYNGAADRPSRLEFFWPVRDAVTIRERRLLGLLARVLDARVTDEVREKKGATYYVSAGVSWSDVYPGFSFLTCSVDVKAADAEKFGRTIRKLALALAEKGIKADELARAKAQALASATQARTSNEYWLEEVLADSQQRPFRLDAARSIENDLSSATVAEINGLAARYLGPDRLFNYLIEPNARMPKKS